MAATGAALLLVALLVLLIAPDPSSALDKQVRVSLQAHVALDDGMAAYLYADGDERPLAPAKAKIKYGKNIGITCSFSTPAARQTALPTGVISGRNPIAPVR